ncbi:MAG: ATP synthase F1 subunit epsilon [Pyrinomonadaceae bacterium]
MLKLEIVTPERRVIDTEAESVTVPTASGEAGILTNHAPLISALKPGVLSYAVKGKAEELAVSTGFVEVSGNQVSILTDVAETADDVDTARAKTDREDAERELAANAAAEAETNAVIRDRIDLANARLTVARGK